jgi:hypothetical protein
MVVFDGVGGNIGRAAFDVMARGGQFCAHGAPSGEFTRIDPREAADARRAMEARETIGKTLLTT